MEYSDLEGTYVDSWVQLFAPYRITKKANHMSDSVKCYILRVWTFFISHFIKIKSVNKYIVAISEFSIRVLTLLKKKVILFDPPRTDFCF